LLLPETGSSDASEMQEYAFWQTGNVQTSPNAAPNQRQSGLKHWGKHYRSQVFVMERARHHDSIHPTEWRLRHAGPRLDAAPITECRSPAKWRHLQFYRHTEATPRRRKEQAGRRRL
jgi:hypothetical protein